MENTDMDKTDSSVEDFLSQLSQEGRFFESSSFTIDSLKAREKLSQFQMADSGLWLVKLVQAAVAAGAPSVRVQFEKRRVKVAFENRCGWQAEELLKEVLSGHLSQSGALFHVVTGLRASAASVNEKVAWSCGGAYVCLDNEGSSSKPDHAGSEFLVEATRPSRQRSLKRTLSSSVYHLAKQTLEEFDAVRSRCWASPIPVYLDGREMDRGYFQVKAGKIEDNPWYVLMRHEKSRNYGVIGGLGMMGIPSQADSLHLPYPLQEILENKDGLPYTLDKPFYKESGCFLRWHRPENQKTGMVVAIYSDYQAESSVDYVLDGALVKRFSLPELNSEPTRILGFSTGREHDVGVRVVVPVAPEQLDLSQFNLREPRVRHALEDSLPYLQEMVATLKQQRKNFWYLPISQAYGKVLGLGFGTQAAIITAISKGMALIPITLVGGITVTVNTSIYRSQAFSGLETLIQRVRDYLKRSVDEIEDSEKDVS